MEGGREDVLEFEGLEDALDLYFALECCRLPAEQLLNVICTWTRSRGRWLLGRAPGGGGGFCGHVPLSSSRARTNRD